VSQLQHLPLSFSRLKALRWLDLKGNPLVPQLAEIAGPCDDTEDCEECARNVVETFSKMVIEIEEERKRRLKEQLQEKGRNTVVLYVFNFFYDVPNSNCTNHSRLSHTCFGIKSMIQVHNKSAH